MFSPLAVPALTAWFLLAGAPSLWECLIPRDTLPPMSVLFLPFSFLSLLVLALQPDSRFSEPAEAEDTEEEAAEGSDVLVRFDNLK